jgi:hypothetical protein
MMKASDISKDEILKAIGLQTRQDFTDYMIPALGLFSAGMLVGAGLGVLFAPKAGSEFRRDLSERMPARGLSKDQSQSDEGQPYLS